MLVCKDEADEVPAPMVEGSADDRRRDPVPRLTAVLALDGLDRSEMIVWRPRPAWTLTLGPRLSLVDDDYMRTYFSVTTAQAVTSGLPAFEAGGGLKSAGALGSVTYQWTPQFATMAYAEYARLLGDAVDSPIVAQRGSPDQVTAGIGAKYSFSVDAPAWRFFPGR
jgi:outer membrane scaffolding protein for murein synthesis (MipA/OmpV family)